MTRLGFETTAFRIKTFVDKTSRNWLVDFSLFCIQERYQELFVCITSIFKKSTGSPCFVVIRGTCRSYTTTFDIKTTDTERSQE
jgi:hypothetical protein